MKTSFNRLPKDVINLIINIDHNEKWSQLCKRTNMYWNSQPRPTLKTFARYLKLDPESVCPVCSYKLKQHHLQPCGEKLVFKSCSHWKLGRATGVCDTFQASQLEILFNKYWSTIRSFEEARIRDQHKFTSDCSVNRGEHSSTNI